LCYSPNFSSGPPLSALFLYNIICATSGADMIAITIRCADYQFNHEPGQKNKARRQNYNSGGGTQGWSPVWRTGLRPVFLRLNERYGFSRKKPRNQADSSSAQMRKGRNRADSDLLFVSINDLVKNQEHDKDPSQNTNHWIQITVT